ncbi:unnamed protein product, partial [Musa textilis]
VTHWPLKSCFVTWIRMSSVQSISLSNRGFLIGPNVTNTRNSSLSWASYTNSTCLYAVPSIEFSQCKVYPRLVHSARKSERCAPVYASGKRGNSKSGNEPFSWESLKKAIGGFKRELTVQDMLSEQAWERQFDGNGDNGISRGGGGNGSGGPEDEGFAGQFDEFLQVIIAVVGVALMVSFSCCLHFRK